MRYHTYPVRQTFVYNIYPVMFTLRDLDDKN